LCKNRNETAEYKSGNNTQKNRIHIIEHKHTKQEIKHKTNIKKQVEYQ